MTGTASRTISSLQCDSLLRRLYALERYVEAVAADLPPYGPTGFAQRLLQHTKVERRKLQNRIKNAGNNEDELSAIAATCGHIVKDLHENYLPFLEHGPKFSLPYELVPSLTALTRHVCPSVEMTLVPSSDYNLGFTGFLPPFGSEFIQGLNEQYWILRLSLPHIEERHGLLHPLLVHEIGHFFDEALGITVGFNIAPAKKQLEDVLQHLSSKASAESHATDPISKASQERIKTKVVKVLSDWLIELVADIYATVVCGPAYFFAFADFSHSVQALEKSDVEHPSPHFRLRQMLVTLEHMHYFEDDLGWPEVRRELDQWNKSIPKDFPTPTDTNIFNLLAYSQLTGKMVKNLVEKVLSKLKECPVMDATCFRKSVPGLAERLSQGLLPAEDKFMGTPASFTGILNAGWAVYLGGLDEFEKGLGVGNDPEDHLRAVANLNMLMLKAVQAAEVYSKWQALPEAAQQ